jgi:hypothetical protein
MSARPITAKHAFGRVTAPQSDVSSKCGREPMHREGTL